MAPSQDEFDNDDSDLRNAPGGRRRPLDRPERIRRQLAQLFWRWNAGDLAAEEATKMAYVLKVMHSMVEGTETARRLADLEARIAELSQP